MNKRFFVIANPASNSGRTESFLGYIKERLTREGLCDEFHVSKNRREPAILASDAALAGFSTIVAVGGDGTLSQVAHGILMSRRNLQAKLALLPMGTGNDAVRNLGLAKSLESGIKSLGEGISKHVDVGCAEFQKEGSSQKRYFINSGSVGISAEVAESINLMKASRGSSVLHSKAIYLIGALKGVFSAKSFVITIHLDGALWFQGSSVFISVANGQYFGGGIRVAPGASAYDGFLQASVVPGWSKIKLLRRLPSFYKGNYVEHEQVLCEKGRQLVCESESTVPVELDGELSGQLPASFQVLSGQLLLVVPR